MFCSNCGKELAEDSNFCQFCGKSIIKTETLQPKTNPKTEKEFVVYKVKKHWMSLLGTYIWGTWLILNVIGMFLLSLIPTEKSGSAYQMQDFIIWLILYFVLALVPFLRYKLDKIEITNKTFNLQTGVLNINKLNMPLDKINILSFKQSILGRILDYGHFVFESAAKTGTTSYKYIQNPDKLNYIINNIENYIKDLNVADDKTNAELPKEADDDNIGFLNKSLYKNYND